MDPRAPKKSKRGKKKIVKKGGGRRKVFKICHFYGSYLHQLPLPFATCFS